MIVKNNKLNVLHINKLRELIIVYGDMYSLGRNRSLNSLMSWSTRFTQTSLDLFVFLLGVLWFIAKRKSNV